MSRTPGPGGGPQGDWFRLGSSSLRGASHQRDGTPNQDSVLVETVGTATSKRVAVIALSDGAGSARYSHHGSRAACAAAVAGLGRQLGRNPAMVFRQHLLRSALQRGVRRARQEVLQTAKRAATRPGPAEVGEYACTILLAVMSESLTGIAHVGDGCVVAGDGREWRLLSSPDNGEFANETTFLTSQRSLPRIRVVPTSQIECLAVMTDGLQDVALSRGRTPYQGFWTPLLNALGRRTGSSPDAVLDSLLRKVNDAGRASDDCTIAVCLRRR